MNHNQNCLNDETDADFQAALQSEVGTQAGADIKAHCAEDRFRLVTEEKIVVESGADVKFD